MSDTVACEKCGQTAEYSHVENKKGVKYDVYFCEEGHATKVKIGEVHYATTVHGYPRR